MTAATTKIDFIGSKTNNSSATVNLTTPRSTRHTRNSSSSGVNTSMNDDGLTLDEKLAILQDRARDITSFLDTLNTLKGKLEKKKATIKEIIEKKIEDNMKELKKWKELLFTIVDESLNEKIDKLDSQASYCKTTHKEIEQVLEASKSAASQAEGELGGPETDEESEDIKLDDLLEVELDLQPDGLSQTETTELESRVKNDFNVLLNEPKKSLRRTFAYVGGIIRGYLRRGKSNINWIKIMRKLEGREFEDRVLSESDPYVGAKINFDENEPTSAIVVRAASNIDNTWNSMTKLFENRNNSEIRIEFCEELGKYYDHNPEDVEFYLPQLCYLLLNQFNQFQPLKRFILAKCRQSIHFALQTYLLIRAAKDSREPPKKKKIIPPSIVKWRILCDQFMQEIQKATVLPQSSPLPITDSVDNVQALADKTQTQPTTPQTQQPPQSNEPTTIEKMFKYHLHFMDSLVEIASHLPTVLPEQYSTELTKRLEKADQYLKELPYAQSGAFAYVPLLRPVGSADYHRVIRIPPKEAYPIPTYGRVLYYFLIEVIDAPPHLHVDHEEKKEHKKKKKDKKEKKEKKSLTISQEDASEIMTSSSTDQIPPAGTQLVTASVTNPSPQPLTPTSATTQTPIGSVTGSALVISPSPTSTTIPILLPLPTEETLTTAQTSSNGVILNGTINATSSSSPKRLHSILADSTGEDIEKRESVNKSDITVPPTSPNSATSIPALVSSSLSGSGIPVLLTGIEGQVIKLSAEEAATLTSTNLEQLQQQLQQLQLQGVPVEEKKHKKKKDKSHSEEGEPKKHHKKKKEGDSSSDSTGVIINQANNTASASTSTSGTKGTPPQAGFFAGSDQPLGSHAAFGELWEHKAKRIKAESPYGPIDRWRMLPLIVKAGEEVLQEEFAMQLIVQFQRIFIESTVPATLLPYRILAVSSKSGLIEPIPNSLSLDKLKKQHTNLLNFFVQAFGETSGPTFKQAQQNFVDTMAAYSIVCYLLQIKDRHNGNILLDASGHLVHIDFGYLLSKTITFEKAPFKLTNEFVDVMGGYKSPVYKEYCRLCVKSYLAVRKHYKKIMMLVEMTMEGKGKKVLPCLQDGQKVLDDLLARFHLDWSDEECEKFVLGLIEEARGSWRTIVYDAYQLILNNIH